MALSRRGVIFAAIAAAGAKVASGLSATIKSATVNGSLTINLGTSDTITVVIGTTTYVVTAAQIEDELAGTMKINVPKDGIALTCTTDSTGTYQCK